MGARKMRSKFRSDSAPTPEDDAAENSERVDDHKRTGRFGPSPSLPLPRGFEHDEDAYVDELLAYTTSNSLLQQLTGGVHILDFLTRDPDFYEWVLPRRWRDWFALHDLADVMDFILREDLALFDQQDHALWRRKPFPPPELLDYVRGVRRLLLRRDFDGPDHSKSMNVHVSMGMKVKKVHEVGSFSRYIWQLAADVEAVQQKPITHLVDFGAGQNYLGRALASQPINRNVIAVESRPENIEGAKELDRVAKLAPKLRILRNKKTWKKLLEDDTAASITDSTDTEGATSPIPGLVVPCGLQTKTVLDRSTGKLVAARVTPSPEGSGLVQHVEQKLENGDLSHVVASIVDREVLDSAPPSGIKTSSQEDTIDTEGVLAVESVKKQEPNLMVISLHSCGNLSHYGIRSLVLNPQVSAIAIVGCCYNLATERLTTPSYKLPGLRPEANGKPLGRLHETAGDPQGFPMSEKFCNYPVRPGKKGIHLNITTRMMAVQAPNNWTAEECESFFTRHFYRSLLQRLFLDLGIIEKPDLDDPHYEGYVAGASYIGHSAASGGQSPGPAIVIGSLRKAAYVSFAAYTRAALAKLSKDPDRSDLFLDKLGNMSTQELDEYERKFSPKKKELSIVWTLMAFSAQLAEAIMVVDRWQWLREQEDVAECWVEPVFDYGKSPRNLAVIGIKN